MRRGGSCGQALTTFGVCQHIRERDCQIVLGGSQNVAQLGHRVPFRRQRCDMDQQAAQQLARGVIPVRISLAGADHQHVGKRAGQAHHVGVVGIERIEPVHRLATGAGNAEGIDQVHVLAHFAAGAGGDGVVLAFEVQHEGQAGIGQQIGDHRADPLAGTGRGAGEDMPTLPEAAIGPLGRIRQLAEGEGIGGCCRSQVVPFRGIPCRSEPGRAVGCGKGRGEHAVQTPCKRPGRSRGPAMSRTTNRHSQSTRATQPSGQKVMACSSASGGQESGTASSNSRENSTAPARPRRM